MKYTNKHNFNLPESADNVDIEKINENFKKIDTDFLTEHPDITTNSPTNPSNVSPGFGGKIAVVTNVSRDANGHVTNFEIKLLELPSMSDITTENVVAPAPNMPIDSSGDTVYLNHVIDGEVASSHFIVGTGGTKVLSHNSGVNMVDGVIEITSSCANTGTFTHDEQNMTIDTGFAETPKIFVLYCNYNGEIIQAAKCRPELTAPFDCVLNTDHLPISGIDFGDGIVTINCHTPTGLSFAWEAYI